MDQKPTHGERFHSLFESAPNPICLEKIDGKLIEVNGAMCDLFGYSKVELLDKSFHDLLHPDDREAWCRKRELLVGGKLPSCQIETRYLTKEGEILWCIGAVTILRDSRETPPCFILQIQNITHIKQLEEQLLQAQKMKAIGTLAGGIAHDFNNLLMAMQGRVSLLLLDTHEGENRYNHLKKMEDHIRRAANLTNQLLGFARGSQYELLETDLSYLVKKELDMFARTRKDIVIHQSYPKAPARVKIDRAQIRQVLVNILINATQAMPDSGTLNVKTETVQLSQFDNKPLEIPPGHFIRISITDTGVGMDQGTRQRIFEPFFTTRAMGRGTGLGLAAAYGIIRHHGGFINAYSEEGQGTTISVYLPSVMQENHMEQTKQPELPTGRGVVLLVDDEAIIIDIGQQMIERLGYEVLTASNGEEALGVYAENRERIDLVILDLIMPGMSGDETFNRLIHAYPEIKIILSSGYSINGKISDMLTRGAVGFIQKPFSMHELAENLRRAAGQ
jgi:PAS domain S-box-containing protein